MKIRKLELCNIASIEKAVIDFDAIPLCDTDLFLITGTTGAGKTTILDGISLALYNTTPRIAKGMTRKEGANTDDLTGDDPRNIVRLNTGYAYSRLFFQGNDKEEYCAEWSVERGKQRKVTGKLSNVIWTVKKLGSTEAVTADNSRKYSDVEEYVRKIVGLDFHQFCRTTMLAQGEFTEFLKSDEKDKAAILEKISGSGIYRNIGIEIYRLSDEADKAYEKEKTRHDEIIEMPPAERAEAESELQQIDSALPEYQQQIGNLLSCINWLKDDSSSRKNLDDATTALETAENIVATDEFKALETDVQQWNETIEVRQQRKNSINETGKAEKASRDLALLETTFAEALAGEAYLNSVQSALEQKSMELRDVMDAQRSNIDAYANCQSIVALIKNLNAEISDLKKKTDAKEKCELVDIPAAVQAHAASSEKLLEASKKLERVQKELETVKESLDRLNLNGLRDEKEFLKETEGIKKEIKDLVDKIEETKSTIADNEQQLKTLAAVSEKEAAELERLNVEHERRKETIHEFARLMRSKLNAHLGEDDNVCPVCGQHVSVLQSNDLIDQEYEKIEKEFNAQQTVATEAATKATTMANLITIAKKSLAEFQRKHAETVERLIKKVADRDDSQKLTEASIEDIIEMITSVSGQISAGVETENRKNSIQDEYNHLLKAKGEAERQKLSDENTEKTVLKKLQDLNDGISVKEESIVELKKSIVNRLAGTTDWQNNWETDADAFICELEEKTGAYNNMQTAYANAQNGISANAPVLENIASIKDEIMMAMPEWSTADVIPVEKKNLQNIWVNLNADVKALKRAYESAVADHERFAKAVQAFLDSHADYTIDRLDDLENISTEAHKNGSKYVNDCRNAVSTLTVQLERATKEWDEHIADRPDSLHEEDTIDSLTDAKSGIEDKRDQLNVRKGELTTKLKDDDDAKRKKSDTTLLEKLLAEKEKWNRFNAVYGDATGSKLCKIAQSYVLGSLINSANIHLKGMAPQYRLLVTEGTLNLKLEDKFNGYATRSTNSISGGESFLVSLALALALADFGQHLGVSTLFIDEGFGTLSGEALQNAINTLKALHTNAGRQVGIISHREEIRDNIPVQIKVTATNGSSASTVTAGQYLNGTFVKAE